LRGTSFSPGLCPGVDRLSPARREPKGVANVKTAAILTATRLNNSGLLFGIAGWALNVAIDDKDKRFGRIVFGLVVAAMGRHVN